jgi:hypothetical protein
MRITMNLKVITNHNNYFAVIVHNSRNSYNFVDPHNSQLIHVIHVIHVNSHN